MTTFLSSKHYPSASEAEDRTLAASLEGILRDDYRGSFFAMLTGYQKTLSDNRQKHRWGELHAKLATLFKCGAYAPLDGPQIGVSMSIRDSDYFRETSKLFGKERSAIASIEWMASCWNMTFSGTGIWMGKTFEPVSRETVARKCENNALEMTKFDKATTRIGRNFFREPHNPGFLQLAGLPALSKLWHLKDRPESPGAEGFDSILLEENLAREKHIPYTRTGGLFLANEGYSVVPGMNGKRVYQLNYRWPGLNPVYPMTRLVDELVQIDDGIFLGQLVMATRNYSIGQLNLPFLPGGSGQTLGPPYRPGAGATLPGGQEAEADYGYQNNGFFLMIDPAYAAMAYADDAFPELRPHPGETGYKELGYDKSSGFFDTPLTNTLGARDDKLSDIGDWVSGWKNNASLQQKFTTFCLEPSPRSDDGDVRELLQDGESILQMLQRIKEEISAQTGADDRLRHFEKLNRLFRSGIAPTVKGGLFQGAGKGYNTRLDCLPEREWYGGKEPCIGFDYYHGATLNLHFGLTDTLREKAAGAFEDSHLFPASVASLLKEGASQPNLLNIFWANIGRYIFPWAGKSFEKISGRKLSMLLDESDDLKQRYPQRIRELELHPASWPHYDLVCKNEQHHWKEKGVYASHLGSGSWDGGMSDDDKAFWIGEASERWVMGNNTQDSRILTSDTMMRVLDMNYRTPDRALLELAEAGPSPFVRQGYIFLGTSDRESILPMNCGPGRKKKVFQFHYRYPMIGGPAPIGTCLDELVEIAEGLYLGQLIYSTLPFVPFHSSVDPAEYKYQLFGYFLLLDNDWEYHRQAIGLDTLR